MTKILITVLTSFFAPNFAHANGLPGSTMDIASGGPVAAVGDTLYFYDGNHINSLGKSADGKTFVSVIIARGGPVAIAGSNLYFYNGNELTILGDFKQVSDLKK